MRNLFAFLVFTLLAVYACGPATTETTQTDEASVPEETVKEIPSNPAEALIHEMVEASGGIDKYRTLKDVEYEYTYHTLKDGKKDVSIERYIYDGEKSWAKYTTHEVFVFPGQEGEAIQGYNGKESWVTFNGERITEPQVAKLADFARKTNFYWLNMMYKLMDPGTNYELLEDVEMNDTKYKRVKITYGENVGDAQDIYLLYINPETKLVDQFLFTVMDFGMANPLLMEVKYEEVAGLKWTTYRRYTQSDWDGNIPEGAIWTEEISKNLKFNTGVDESIFTLKEES